MLVQVAQTSFDTWVAERYERLWPELYRPDLLDDALEALAGLAGDAPALELGIGTGRVALPLHRRGVPVHGIELSAAMVDVLRRQDGADGVEVLLGDMATADLSTRFGLVYVLRSTITNLTTQDEQVACFGNASGHLRPGGWFVVDCYVPAVQQLAPGGRRRVFVATDEHVGVEEYDLARQVATSRHWWTVDGELRTFASEHRYVWPAELDLMARLAGLEPVARWSSWRRDPFTAKSRELVALYRRPT